MENYLLTNVAEKRTRFKQKKKISVSVKIQAVGRGHVFIWLLTVANFVLETMLRNVYACLTGPETPSQSSQIFQVDSVFVSIRLRSTK